MKLHASVDLADALEVARQIDYLGGDLTVKVKDTKYSQDSRKMLVIGLKQEQVIFKRSRKKQSSGTLWRICASGSINGILAQEQDNEIDLRDALG